MTHSDSTAPHCSTKMETQMTHTSIVLPNMETSFLLFSQSRKLRSKQTDSTGHSESTPIVLFLLFYPYGNEQHTLLIVLYIGMSMSHCSLPIVLPIWYRTSHSLTFHFLFNRSSFYCSILMETNSHVHSIVLHIKDTTHCLGSRTAQV